MSQPLKPTWYILGPGAIGCLWASYLRLAGFPVVLINRSAVESSSIELTVKNQKKIIDIESIQLRKLIHQQPNIEPQSIHNLLITTKAQHTVEAVQSIKHLLAAQASILIVQNGMAAKLINDTLSQQKVYIGITTDGAYRTSRFSVTHAGHGETLVGSYNNRHPIEPLLKVLPTQQLTINACDDISIRQWQKLAVNAAINGLTVIYDCKNGQLLKSSSAMQQIKALCKETTNISQALNLPTQSCENLFQTVCDTLNLTADNFSSMYQDIKQGRSTEVDFINGYLCEQAIQSGMPCPENEKIVAAIKKLEQDKNND